MTKISVKVNGSSLTASADGKLTSGMVGVGVSIDYDNSWDNLIKTASFRAGSFVRSRRNIQNSTTIPWEVMRHHGKPLEVGVEGRDEDGNIVIPTVWAVVGTIYEGAVRDIPGSPNPDDGGGDDASSEAVLYVKQNLTEEQKAQARANIGAVAVSDVVSAALARGTVAQARYVSPLSHDVKVKLSSDATTGLASTTVAVYGKNLFDKTTATIGVGLSTGTGGTYASADYLTSDYIPITPNTRLFINWIQDKWACCYDAEKKYLGQATRQKETDEASAQNLLITIAGTRFIRFTAAKAEIDSLQLEVSRFPTEYEPYVAPQMASADSDGNVYGLKSVSPSMTLIADSDVAIEVEYYQIASATSDAKVERTLKPHTVIGVNHRGFNTVAPENTLPAYKLSKANGFDFAEGDVRWTSDGVPVLMHDKTINRTARNSDGTALSSTLNIADISYATALKYDYGIWKGAEYAGTKIPTFTEFVSLCRRLSLHPYIEISGSISVSQAETLVGIVSDFGMLNNVTWVGFSASSLYNICRVHPEARVGYLIDINATWVHDDDYMLTLKALKTPHNNVFGNVSYQNVNALLSDFKAEKIPMEAWGVTTEAEIVALDPYVTGVASDSFVASKVLAESVM